MRCQVSETAANNGTAESSQCPRAHMSGGALTAGGVVPDVGSAARGGRGGAVRAPLPTHRMVDTGLTLTLTCRLHDGPVRRGEAAGREGHYGHQGFRGAGHRWQSGHRAPLRRRAVAARGGEGLRRRAQPRAGRPARRELLRVDITDPASVAALAEQASDVDLLVNNAGIATVTSLLTGDIATIRTEMETHYFGTLSMVRAFAPILTANGGGTVVNVLSALSWFSYTGSRSSCQVTA